ncbi:hypothetical protein GPJ56_003762 [Histomonas meleagridis]|uniref:uncharacterized protein n=1 Tax=Histomonas meleagridis TaxID=135588 RepID=UPI0035599F24|nr:hypothetical protein GPJ56_003762 [Histomonas meleagridis]KAH0805220.1 hypothetical protein GO595_002165 [Histomonas meleagridis]
MVISEQEISQPGIIYQRKLTESSRLFTINHLILNTTRHFNSYGIQISHFDDLQSFSTVNLHTSQIRDLCSDGNTFITASLDQSVSFSSLETESKIADFHFDVPLWSCTQLNDTLIACGGDRGWVYGIDTRSGTRFFERQIVGPPINSMSTCDNTLLFLSAHSINFYDFIKGDFIEVHTNIDGGFSLRKTEDSELFSLIQRQGNNAAMFYCRFERQSVFKMFKMVPMKYFSQIPGTAMRSIDGNVYAAVPNEQSCDISLYTLSQQNNNIWEKWKERWDYEKNNKPILDVAIDAEDSMTVSTLSCDRLTVYQIPIKFV